MSESDQVRLVVFDCDGTLVDSQHNICAAMRASYEQGDLEAPSDGAIRRIVGLSLAEAVDILSPGISNRESSIIQEGYKANFMRIRQSPEYRDPLYPGIRQVLIELEEAGFLLAIATGKSQRGLAATLAHHDLTSTFVSLQTEDDAPGKPHPGMLELAMSDTGATPETTVMLGDTVFDMTMAQNAGTSAIGVSWGYHQVEELRQSGAHAIIDRCDELLPVAEHLIGA